MHRLFASDNTQTVDIFIIVTLENLHFCADSVHMMNTSAAHNQHKNNMLFGFHIDHNP
jgi:hypothetical protein